MVKNKSWMKAAAALFAATVLTAGAMLAQDKGASKTYQGVVTDAMCGAQHGMMGNIPDKQCVLGCVKGGSKYALIVGKKVYTLDGNSADFEKFAAAKVKVTGTVSGDTLHAESIAGAGTSGLSKLKAPLLPGSVGSSPRYRDLYETRTRIGRTVNYPVAAHY